MSKKITIFIIFILIINSLSCFGMEQDSFTSKSVILINSEDGRILFEKDSKEKLYPASITKIMLLVLVSEKIENGELTLKDEVVVSENASGMGGSQVYLEANEIQTVENLIKAICIRSSNDAALAMAEHVAGSEEEFVSQMNKKAVKLGMTNTNFQNVTGLHDDNHYSCAYDVALMSQELLKYEYLRPYLTTWIDSIYVGKEKDVEQVLVNTNKLVKTYKGILGVKTGYTSKSLYCLSLAAERNNMKLIGVVLCCSNSNVRFKEAEKLLNYGFANYKNINFYNIGDEIKQSKIDCANEDNFFLTVHENVNILVDNDCNKEDYELQYEINEGLRAPISKDTPVGKIKILKDNAVKKEISLYPIKDIPKASFGHMLFKSLKNILFN